MKRSILLSTAAITAAFAAPAFAADDAAQLDDVVVTATRLPAIVADTPGARVIDSKTIEQRGAVFATDILSDVPGLSVYRASFGGVASVRMRGASQDKTLVLVDGVAVNDPSQPAGGFDFSGFDLGDVSRIEVLSGPQSSLWGSSAIGGVISFTTSELNGVSANAEAGSYGTARGRLGLGVATEKFAYGVSVSKFHSDGFSAADKINGNTEKDGFDNTTVSARARYELNDRFGVDASYRYSDTDADVDGFGPVDALDTAATVNQSGLVRLRVADVLGLDHKFTVAASDIDRVAKSAYPSVYSGQHRLYRWQADSRDQNARLAYSFGAEHEETQADLDGRVKAELDVDSVFGVARFNATDRLSVTAGLRHDETDKYGGKTTGRISAAYDLGAGLTFSGAYGTGFKTPSVAQTVCDFCFVLPSTKVAELVPEKAESGELALGWRSNDGRFDGRLTAYRLEVENQIDGYYNPASFEYYYVNLIRTRTDGVELEGRVDLGRGFDLTAAYAWTDAENAVTKAPILRVAEHSGSATLGWTGQRLSGAVTVRAEGEMPDSGGMRDGFVITNLNGAYALTDNVTLTARVENLFDEHYQRLLGYGEAGLSGYVGIRLRY